MLTPVFSFWTYGPKMSGGCYTYKNAEPRLPLSFRLTWVNSIITFASPFLLITLNEFVIKSDILLFFTADSWIGHGSFLNFFVMHSLPLFVLAIICLILVQHLDKCSCFCCKCFTENCLPMTEKKETLVEEEGLAFAMARALVRGFSYQRSGRRSASRETPRRRLAMDIRSLRVKKRPWQ